MLTPGQVLTLTIDKPAAGGRMIARENGQVVLVSGTIPGERVDARVERVSKGVAYAQTVVVHEPSSDRRSPSCDPLCGGVLYAHIAYARQLAIKAQVVADAFARIAKAPLAGPVAVAPSPEDGYRMRARFHVRGGRLGFFREGTHDLCDVRATRQLLPATCDALDRLTAALRSSGVEGVQGIELSENVDASERVVHLDAGPGVDPRAAARLTATDGFTPGPHVTDRLRFDDGTAIELRRHVLAFFQGNRFLLRDLVAHVAGQLPADGDVVDLYAGVGLFALAAAARGARVVAVEGDRFAAADLAGNARAGGGTVAAVHQAVEAWAATARSGGDAMVVDPPRTGLSREALDGLTRLRPPRVVYVSCDVATLARDTRRLVDAGYASVRVDAFDLFPNTPHVETVVTFER